jgi:hypothetical protein
MEFREVTEWMNNVYERKNADYGNSFGETFEEYGLVSADIRLNDKFKRFKRLLKNEAQVQEESIKDTLLDIANYAVLTLVEMSKRETH